MEYIVTDSNNVIICKGLINSCKEYLNQMNIDIEKCIFIPYEKDTYLYEDFNLIKILNINIFITEGQYLILKESVDMEKENIKFIEKELNTLLDSHIFSKKGENIILNMFTELEILKNEHEIYLANEYIYNIDKEVLNNLMEELYIRREKNLLPIKYFEKR